MDFIQTTLISNILVYRILRFLALLGMTGMYLVKGGREVAAIRRKYASDYLIWIESRQLLSPNYNTDNVILIRQKAEKDRNLLYSVLL